MTEEIDEKYLNVLENRIKKLEKRIFAECTTDEVQHGEILSSLTSVSQKLGNALSTRDRMMMVMKRLDELESYLDPHYGESLNLGDSVKADLILDQEADLRQQHEHLCQLSDLSKKLDSHNFGGMASSLNGKLCESWQKYEQTEKLVVEQNEQIANLVQNYDSAIRVLNESLIQKNAILLEAEKAAAPRQYHD